MVMHGRTSTSRCVIVHIMLSTVKASSGCSGSSRCITEAGIIHGRRWQCIGSGTGSDVTRNGTRYRISVGPLVRIGAALHITGVHWPITGREVRRWRCCTSVALILLRNWRLLVLMLIVLSSEIIVGGSGNHGRRYRTFTCYE